MQPKVSIIIPVYNVEKYIRKCLDSVVNQTLRETEIILVNDGSKDASGVICQEYADRYPNISYFYQENAGSAAARNCGLDHAQGEYVGFVDSDDWIEPDMYEKLYETAKANQDTDIVMCRVFEEECPGSREYIFPREGFYNKEQIKKEIIPYMFPAVTSKGNFRNIRWSNVIRLFKRKLIAENLIRSCEGVSNGEDLGFLAECTLHASTYYYLPEALYHNVVNLGSQSRNYVSNMWQRTKKLIVDIHRYIDGYNDAELSRSLDFCIFYYCTMVLRNECKAKAKKHQLEMVQAMLDDPECKRALCEISPEGMNSEYSSIYYAMKTGIAKRAVRCMNRISFKKNTVFPIVERILSNRYFNKAYSLLRHRS